METKRVASYVHLVARRLIDALSEAFQAAVDANDMAMAVEISAALNSLQQWLDEGGQSQVVFELPGLVVRQRRQAAQERLEQELDTDEAADVQDLPAGAAGDGSAEQIQDLLDQAEDKKNLGTLASWRQAEDLLNQAHQLVQQAQNVYLSLQVDTEKRRLHKERLRAANKLEKASQHLRLGQIYEARQIFHDLKKYGLTGRDQPDEFDQMLANARFDYSIENFQRAYRKWNTSLPPSELDGLIEDMKIQYEELRVIFPHLDPGQQDQVMDAYRAIEQCSQEIKTV